MGLSSLYRFCQDCIIAIRGYNFQEGQVAEAALAHVVGDETERAYRRGDALDKRRELMDAWAAFCEGSGGNVVAFPARA